MDPVQDLNGGLGQDPSALDVFVSVLDPTLTSLLFSTYLGECRDDSARDLALAPNGRIVFTGGTGGGGGNASCPDFPTTADALQPSFGGGLGATFGDGFVSIISPVMGTTTTTVPVEPGQTCGDPVVDGSIAGGYGDGLKTASDALFILRAAVGRGACARCICDVNGDGLLTATDALIALAAAVGQAVSLS